MFHALLIDDEASARADLRAKLALHPGVQVVGEAATIRAARELLARPGYDLVFLDVQLIGGESFQLVPEVRPGASIVFATAHERYALRAFESRAVDYLLKPIDPARLAESLQRVTVAAAAGNTVLPAGVRARPPAGRAASAEVVLSESERVTLRQALESWEDSLDRTHVLRAPSNDCARVICYRRRAQCPRLFVDGAGGGPTPRWWHALRARLAPRPPPSS